MTVWFWCLHCQRAFPVNLADNAEKDPEYGHWKDTPHRCPYPGCDAHVGDIMDWDFIRKHNPHFPEKAERDTIYALDGDASASDGSPSDFKPGDLDLEKLELEEDEFWCVTVQGAAKILDISVGKVRLRILAGRLTKLSPFGQELVPLPQIAKNLGETDREVLEKAIALDLTLTVLGAF